MSRRSNGQHQYLAAARSAICGRRRLATRDGRTVALRSPRGQYRLADHAITWSAQHQREQQQAADLSLPTSIPRLAPGGRAVSHPRSAPASQSCGCSVMDTIRLDARSETAGRSRDRPPGLEVVGLAVGCELGIEVGVGSGSAQRQDRGIAAAAAECLASCLARQLIGDARAPARASTLMGASRQGH